MEMFGDPISSAKYPTQPLATLGQLERGVSKIRPRNDPSLLGGPYPLIQTGDVANSGLFINKFSSTYSEKGLAQSKMWKRGTLCITIAANIAETGILECDACFPDSLVGFAPGPLINNIYLHYWFELEKEQIRNNATGVAQKNINLAVLRNLRVQLPPKSEQLKFISFVFQIDKSGFVVRKEIENLQELLNSKMDEYFGQ
jgi:type I restriction enzyme S subunit